MFMGLWNPVRKSERRGKNRMTEGKFDEVCVREDLLHLAPEGTIHTIVIVSVQKAAAFEVGPQALRFNIGERDIAVARKEEERVGKELLTGDVNIFILWVDVDGGVSADEAKQVHLCRRIIVPIAAAGILDARNGEGAERSHLGIERGSRERCDEEKRHVLHAINVEIGGTRYNRWMGKAEPTHRRRERTPGGERRQPNRISVDLSW